MPYEGGPDAAHPAGEPYPGSRQLLAGEPDFIGPLRRVDAAWAEHTVRADSTAALFEPVDTVIRRRESHIGSLYRTAALLSLAGDQVGSTVTGFRAVAESRALVEFLAASPAYCLDCFLLGERCESHQAAPPATGRTEPAADAGPAGPLTGKPDWRRFGADESPSASG
jgi:hypothetical protein